MEALNQLGEQFIALLLVVVGMLMTPIIFIGLDMWAGIRKAKTRGEKIMSNKMKRTADKIARYYNCILAMMVLDVIQITAFVFLYLYNGWNAYTFPFFTLCSVVFVAAIEIKSIYEPADVKEHKQMKEIAAAFGTLSQEVISEIQAAEASGTGYVLNLASGDVTLNKGDYEISSEDMPGWLVATEGAMTIALDVTITEELKQEGVARELINRIQNLRKSSGFEVTDKVDVKIFADGEAYDEIIASLANFAEYVGSQTLARTVVAAQISEAGDAPEVEWNEGTIRIAVVR